MQKKSVTALQNKHVHISLEIKIIVIMSIKVIYLIQNFMTVNH
jgi:hypothetical protein